MFQRRLGLDADAIQLPRGTRVVLRTDIRGPDGYVHRTAAAAIVRGVTYNTYDLESPSGRAFSAERDQIQVQRQDLLHDLGLKQWDYRKLRSEVIYAVVVGSQAWGLAGPDSDEDVRGAFLAPFDEAYGLWRCPEEIHDPDHEEGFWEVERIVYQGLRGDANTLETLWSPLVREATPLGEALIENRRMFVSMNVVGSFGRYAQSQFDKIERSMARDNLLRSLIEGASAGTFTDRDGAIRFLARHAGCDDGSARNHLKAIMRSLLDRGLLDTTDLVALFRAVAEGRGTELEPEPHRPKNAYNLLRLLHSCMHWIQHGEPLIEVSGDLKTTLLAIKAQETPIEETIQKARAVARDVEAMAPEAKLPETPDYDAADAFLRRCRRESARQFFLAAPKVSIPGLEAFDDALALEWFPTPLPPDIDMPALRRFLEGQIEKSPPVILLGLTGAHAYGFPSVDSDLDLKGAHLVSAQKVLGLTPKTPGINWLGEIDGREYDYTTHDLASYATLLVKGNGNALEQLLGPFPVLKTGWSHRLAELAQAGLSQMSQYHYKGFFKGMRKEYEREKAAGARKAKRLLYAYRVALTGCHLLRAGELVMDVRPLAEQMGYPRVRELVELKKTHEKGVLPEDMDDAPYLEDFLRLEEALVEAAESSPLPKTCPNEAEIEALVVEARLSGSVRQDITARYGHLY